MALSGAYHAASGSAVQLSTLLPSTVKQIDIIANPGNAAVIYIGPSTVTAAGVNAYIALAAGKSWGAEADEGSELHLELQNLYIIGTASDKAHMSYVN